MKNSKIGKSLNQSHTSNDKIVKGDSYGTGIKNKIGKPIQVMGLKKESKNYGKPPKSLA